MTNLRHVLWIGGASASGKTTVATALARRHGLRWYSADAHTWEHRDIAIGAGNKAAIRWEAMTLAERAASLAATPAEHVKLNLDFERGPMILDDVRRLPPAPLVIADGSTVLPEVVAHGHAEHARAVWLLPTFEVHRTHHEREGMTHLVAYRWLVVQEIERQAVEQGVNVLRVDGTVGTDDALAAVEGLFADAIAEGPCAETVDERRALIRYANEAIVTQARGYLARPWASGDEETFVREFLCECGDRECRSAVELAVAAFPGATRPGAVLADGHG